MQRFRTFILAVAAVGMTALSAYAITRVSLLGGLGAATAAIVFGAIVGVLVGRSAESSMSRGKPIVQRRELAIIAVALGAGTVAVNVGSYGLVAAGAFGAAWLVVALDQMRRQGL